MIMGGSVKTHIFLLIFFGTSHVVFLGRKWMPKATYTYFLGQNTDLSLLGLGLHPAFFCLVLRMVYFLEFSRFGG